MNEFVVHIEEAFHKSSLARCTSIAVFQMILEGMDEEVVPIELLSEIIRSLLFVRKTDERLDKAWKSPEGKLASQVWRRVMRCCLNMARRNVFEVFNEVAGDNKPLIPWWLTRKVEVKGAFQEYLVKGHVEHAVDTCEVRRNPSDDFDRREKVLRRSFPHRSDVGIHVFTYLYSLLKNLYTDTRRSAREVFFKKIGYLLMDWTEFPQFPVHDSTVVMGWVEPVRGSISDIISCGVMKKNKTYVPPYKAINPKKKDSWDELLENSNPVVGEKEDVQSDGFNATNYVDFCRSVKDVTLLVEHDIVLRKPGVKDRVVRRRVGSNKRRIRKAVNLMDIVRKILEHACGFGADHVNYDILKGHAWSTALIYSMARTLRVIIDLKCHREILNLYEGYTVPS